MKMKSSFSKIWILLCALMPAMLTAQEVVNASIRVTVEPAAALTVNHKAHSEGTSFQLTLPPNVPALLQLSAPGYKTEYRTLWPMPGERKHEAFELKRESTPVLFRSTVPAKVLCDGQELGTTPFHHFFTEPKAYRILFRADGFDDHVLRLNLEHGRPQVVDAELVADSATLVVESDPAGAAIQINGVPRGVTPGTFSRLREGAHAVVLRLPGYHTYEETVDLKAGEQTTLEHTLRRLPSALTIKSNPKGATVYINGLQRGQTPLTVNDLAEGAYAVRVEMPNYEAQVRRVTLKAGETTSLECALETLRGEVKVQTQPGTVQVFVDGKPMATTAPETKDSFTSAVTTLTLPVGEHTLLFRADGYADVQRKITVKTYGNEVIKLRLNFSPNFEIRTDVSVYRGVLVRRDPDGSIALELRPGVYRTFAASEIRSARFWEEKNASATR